MKRSLHAGLALTLAALLGAAACSDGTTEPAAACPAGTSSVTATVTRSGSDVVFDWTPKCPVALVLVEQDAADMWAISPPGLSTTSTAASNVILPSVTYGKAPAGTEEDPAASPLVAGTSYDLVLWMIVPASAPCAMRMDNACLVTVKSFVK